MPWVSVYLFSFVFFVLVGSVCSYSGVGCLKKRKYMRLYGLEGKEDLEGDRGLERIWYKYIFWKKSLKTSNKKVGIVIYILEWTLFVI